MKYSINSDHLKKTTEKLFLLIDLKDPIGDGDKFKLTFLKDSLQIEASNVRNGIYAKSEIKVMPYAEDYPTKDILVKALDLYNLSKSLTNVVLTFTILEEEIVIETNTGRYRFTIYPTNNWLANYISKDEEFIFKQSISTDRIKRVLQKSIYLAPDVAANGLTGILFDFDYNQLRIVATDGYRMLKYTLNGITTENPQKIRLNTISTKILAKVITGGDEIILKYCNAGLLIETGNFLYSAKTIQQKYANYESVFEKELKQDKQEIFIDKSILLDSVIRLHSILQADSIQDDQKKAEINVFNNKLKLTVDSTNNNYSLTDYIDCIYSGPRLFVVLNLAHLKEILFNIEVEGQIKMLLGEPTRPLFIAVEQAPEELLVLFTPIKEQPRRKQEEENENTNNNNNTEDEL